LSSAPHLSRLELSASYGFAGAILALHLAAALSIHAAIGGPAGVLLGAALLALGCAAACARALHLGGTALRAIELAGPGEAALHLRDGRVLRASIGARRTVNRFWVSLPVTAPVRRTILVARDMLEPQAFRALRLWALWGRVPSVASGQLGA
jgi:hypothetical protein